MSAGLAASESGNVLSPTLADLAPCVDLVFILLSVGTPSNSPLFRFFHSPCYFAYLPLNYPLKSPLARTLQTFPTYTRTENLFFKSAPYQDYNEGLVPISRSGFFFHPASSVHSFLPRICTMWCLSLARCGLRINCSIFPVGHIHELWSFGF